MMVPHSVSCQIDIDESWKSAKSQQGSGYKSSERCAPRDWEYHAGANMLRCEFRPLRIYVVSPTESGKPWEGLPERLRRVGRAIEASRKLLELAYDWDDEGALPIQETTWQRAAGFVARQARWLWDFSGISFPTPDIAPVPDGSIDLHWDRPHFELLINIPPEPSVPAGFYGDDRGSLSIQGHLDTSRLNEALILWLARV
jgi:hypothetical protein